MRKHVADVDSCSSESSSWFPLVVLEKSRKRGLVCDRRSCSSRLLLPYGVVRLRVDKNVVLRSP